MCHKDVDAGCEGPGWSVCVKVSRALWSWTSIGLSVCLAVGGDNQEAAAGSLIVIQEATLHSRTEPGRGVSLEREKGRTEEKKMARRND